MTRLRSACIRYSSYMRSRPKLQVVLKSSPEGGVDVVKGHRRLKAALAFRDEVVVESAEHGDVLIAKLPDGRLIATNDKQALKQFA